MAVCNKIILFLFLFNKLFDNAEYCLITQDNKLKKKKIVSVMNMLLIYLFASMKLEKGHKKDYMALVLKICYTVLFYKIG